MKTPNLLLAALPREDEEVVVKIAAFGLSRDKGLDSVHYQQTVMMTGCGSVLWMVSATAQASSPSSDSNHAAQAPEILLGERYNEKVDVYS